MCNLIFKNNTVTTKCTKIFSMFSLTMNQYRHLSSSGMRKVIVTCNHILQSKNPKFLGKSRLEQESPHFLTEGVNCSFSHAILVLLIRH